jgi:hypothetical protein
VTDPTPSPDAPAPSLPDPEATLRSRGLGGAMLPLSAGIIATLALEGRLGTGGPGAVPATG